GAPAAAAGVPRGAAGGAGWPPPAPPPTAELLMSPTLAAVLLIGIFVLAAALIWLGLGLARRAKRRDEAAPPLEADRAARAPTVVAAPSEVAAPPAPGLRDRLGKTRA